MPNSFFEKLKKGMGVAEEIQEQEPPKQAKRKGERKKVLPKELKIEKKPLEKGLDLARPEGELTVDIYQTENDLVVQSAVAGVKPENLDISIERDILTIKGSRENPFEGGGDYFTQECYWGPFSREIILPVEVDPNRTEAIMEEGILTIRIPKILREKKRKITVKG